MLMQGTLFFQLNDFGWSENYGIDQTTYALGASALQAILTPRLALLHTSVTLVGARLSDTAVKGDSFPLGFAFPQAGTFSTASGTANLDLAVRVLMQAGSLKRGQRWLHGLPNTVIAAGGAYATVTAWESAVTTWINAVITNAKLFTRIVGATTPPFFTASVYTAGTLYKVAFSRKIGRPFGLPRGRRVIV